MAFIGQFAISVRGVRVERKVGEGQYLGMELKVWGGGSKFSNLKPKKSRTKQTLITGSMLKILLFVNFVSLAFTPVSILAVLSKCICSRDRADKLMNTI